WRPAAHLPRATDHEFRWRPADCHPHPSDQPQEHGRHAHRPAFAGAGCPGRTGFRSVRGGRGGGLRWRRHQRYSLAGRHLPLQLHPQWPPRRAGHRRTCHEHMRTRNRAMKKTGAALARFALEQLGVSHTFGIPGVHNTELYDELNASDSIQPVLVTHECSATFMADAFSRTVSCIGILVIVPAAGVTHAARGIGEAGLNSIHIQIIYGGINYVTSRRYQLHDIDQHALLAPITKSTFRILSHVEVIPTLYQAYRIATGGEPGPVFVELPYNIGNFLGEVAEMPPFVVEPLAPSHDPA